MNYFNRRSRIHSPKELSSYDYINRDNATSNNILYVISIYLWIHGIGFTGSYRRNFKNSVKLLLSLFLLFIFESNRLFIISHGLILIVYGDEKINKEFIFVYILTTVEWFLRISLFTKRKVLMFIVKRVFDKYSNIISQKTNKFKLVLIFVLLALDACTLLLYLYFSYCFIKTGILDDSVETELYHKFFGPSISTLMHYIREFVLHWSSMMLFVPLYFCSLGFVLKNILIESKKKLIREKIISYQSLFESYAEISQLISYVNEKMQSLLLSTMFVLLGNIFFCAYVVVFTKYALAYNYVCIILYCTMFIMMCLFASGVTNAAVDLADTILSQPIIQYGEKGVQFLQKVKTGFIGFKLLDSLIIDKNLILSATGSLLTYGLMIATFNANSGA